MTDKLQPKKKSSGFILHMTRSLCLWKFMKAKIKMSKSGIQKLAAGLLVKWKIMDFQKNTRDL